MSKTLLAKNTRSLLVWLPVVLVVSSLLFYIMLEMHAHHMQEKQLLLKQRDVWSAFILEPDNFLKHVKGEYDIIEQANGFKIGSEPRDTTVYYQDQKQSLPFEVSTAYYSLNGKQYALSTYVSSKEINHLIAKVFISEAVILVLLLVTVVIVNKKSSISLWSPFFSTIKSVRQYDITRNQNLKLPEATGTREFDELNREITNLIRNVNQAYLQQKEFVENASHEMQTPLAIIRSKLELLINQPSLTEKSAFLLADITEANDRLSQMNRTLLLLAKIENNQFPDVEEIKISRLIKQLIFNYREHYTENFPRLTENFVSEITVIANHSLIEILLSNLVKNSIEHNEAGGEISITTGNSTLSIKNTGPPPETQPELLLQRFKKGSHQSKTTGLGLALVKQICILYGYSLRYTYKSDWHEVVIHFNKMPVS
jgi:signal transduction histidine kinase